MIGKLIAGAAKRCITPPAELMADIVKESTKYNFDGVYDDVYVRVMFLSDGVKKSVIITADLNRFPFQNVMANMLSERYGIDPTCCIFGCTRNHHAPNDTSDDENPPWMRRFKPDRKPMSAPLKKYEDFILNATEEALVSAMENACPARMGYTVTTSSINAYRDWITPAGALNTQDLDGYRDNTLVVMRIEDMEGKTIGIFVNYALRGCMTPFNKPEFNKITSDLPGAVSRFVERAGGDKYTVLWTCGGGADQDAIVKSDVEYIGINESGTFTKVHEELPVEAVLMLKRKLASAQGLRILDSAGKIGEYTDEYECDSFETFREIPSRIAYNDLGLHPKPYEKVEPIPHPHQSMIILRLRLAVINGMAFCGINGEIYTRVCRTIRELIPCKATAILDMSYGNVGCIPDGIGDSENGYGGRSTYCLSGDEADRAICDGFCELAGAYAEKQKKH